MNGIRAIPPTTTEKVLEIHKVLCSWLLVVGLTIFITDVMKLYVGYLRPIFYDVCQPNENDNYETCANDVKQIRLSFPSGHASLSFAGFLLFSIQLERLYGISSLRRQRQRSVVTTTSGGEELTQYAPASPTSATTTTVPVDRVGLLRLVSLLCYTPMLGAFYIAASRLVDNKHFPADVVGGATLGSAVAMLITSIW